MKRCFLPTRMAILAAVLLSPAITDAQSWRLDKTESYYSNQTGAPLTLSLKTQYSYSGARGSSPDNKEILYDNKDQYYDRNNPNRVSSRTTHTYNGNNAMEEQFIYNYSISTSQLEPTSKLLNTYVNGRLDSVTAYQYHPTQKVYEVQSTGKYIYDANGNTIKEQGYDVGTGAVVDVLEHDYDANNRVLRDSSYFFNNGVPQTTYVINYTYDNNGNLIVTSAADYSTGVKVDVGIHYYYYDANGLLKGDSAGALPPGDVHKRAYEYDAQARLIGDTAVNIIDIGGGAIFADSTIGSYQYTSFGHLEMDEHIKYSMNTTFNINHDSNRHFYAMYFPVSTGTVAQQDADLVAYPIPGNDFLNIKLQLSKPTRINARILNMQGQTVAQWSDNADDVYYKSIKVDGLMTGNYYLVVDVDGVKMTKAITIAK